MRYHYRRGQRGKYKTRHYFDVLDDRSVVYARFGIIDAISRMDVFYGAERANSFGHKHRVVAHMEAIRAMLAMNPDADAFLNFMYAEVETWKDAKVKVEFDAVICGHLNRRSRYMWKRTLDENGNPIRGKGTVVLREKAEV